ncbi:MAG: Imm51 family immunity protein [Deltaproteobacteria bacterium]
MYDECIEFIEDEENDFVSVCLYVEDGALAALGERINAAFEDAYMNGYNWDILISAYVRTRNPALANKVERDPEAGLASFSLAYSRENIQVMRSYKVLVHELLKDEGALFQFIRDTEPSIDWD